MKKEPDIVKSAAFGKVSALLGRGLDFLLPPLCFGCAAKVQTQGGLCAECWAGLRFITAPFCRICGFPFAHEMPEGVLCASCHQHTPNFKRARAALAYDPGSRPLILAFKHGDKSQGLKTMGQWLKRAAEGMTEKADVIIPVPLHPARLRRRKFNQAALLARALEMETGLPLDLFGLARKKNTPTQGGLTRHKRMMNVSGAFRVTDGGKERLKGKNVILVDDVLTTGATVDNCTRALMKAKAGDVFVLTLARVVEPLARKTQTRRTRP